MFPARSSQFQADPIDALPFDGPAFESRVTWIFGSPRTGSTWLLRMLLHPLKAGEEPSGLQRKRPGLRAAVSDIVVPVNESHVPLHLTPLRRVKSLEPDEIEPDEFLLNSRHIHRPSYVFADAHADTAWPWMRSMILDRFYAQAEAAMHDYGAEDCAVVVKEPNGSHGAHRIMSLMPNAKLIYLIRDGRDVIDSALTLRLPGGDRSKRRGVRDDEADRLRYVTIASRLWVNRMNAVQRAFDHHQPERRLKVRYEDLRNDAAGELTRIVDFLGLERTAEQVTAAVEAQAYKSKARKPEGRRAASSGEWRKSLRVSEQKVAEEIMGPKLAELGYA